MKRILILIIAVVTLLVMEGISWMILKSSREEPQKADQETLSSSSSQELPLPATPAPEAAGISPNKPDSDSESFPPPTTEVKNGRTERTIHMGVRQYAWDPPILRVKRGELVRLIVHNADVQHGLVIPELNVLNIDIPPEGTVIEFVPDKVGTFVFFCSYYCGEGHSEMRGKIIVE